MATTARLEVPPHSARHVVLSTIGSAGDVNPFVAIGRELRRRGHRVTLVTNAYFEPLAVQAGLDFVPLGAAEDYVNAIEDPGLWDSRNAFRVLARRVLVPAIRPLYRILSGLLDSSTVLVAQGQAFGAHLAHGNTVCLSSRSSSSRPRSAARTTRPSSPRGSPGSPGRPCTPFWTTWCSIASSRATSTPFGPSSVFRRCEGSLPLGFIPRRGPSACSPSFDGSSHQ